MKRLVLVSGAPGSGKTTLARPLAIALGLPLFSKDYIKESLVRTLGGASLTTQQLGAAAMETLWMLAEYAPAAVLEANFRPKSDYELARIRNLNACVVEVFCDCGPDEAAKRFAERARAADHDRSAHSLAELSADLLAQYDRPVGIGKVVRVDTRHAIDVSHVASLVRAAMSPEGS